MINNYEQRSTNRKAIFVDRDGVIIDNVIRDDGSKGSIRKISDLKIADGVKTFLSRCVDAEFIVVAVTNQPDIARGKLNLSELEAINAKLLRQLPEIKKIYVCPHDNADNCKCRKPKPGLFFKARSELGINLSKSWMVGDRASDVDASFNADIHAICIPSQFSAAHAIRLCNSNNPHLIAEDILDAWSFIANNVAVTGTTFH